MAGYTHQNLVGGGGGGGGGGLGATPPPPPQDNFTSFWSDSSAF